MDTRLLGQRICPAREATRLSQEELAALVAKEQGAISEYESGRRRLAAADLSDFAKALEVPLMYFYERESDTSELDQAMLVEFHRLPTPEAKQGVIDIVRILCDRFGSV